MVFDEVAESAFFYIEKRQKCDLGEFDSKFRV